MVFYGWTKKGETTSVCPPESISKNIFTIRIHLDDTDEKNGALKIIPGSHQKKLTDEEIQLITNNSLAYSAKVFAGGIQLMKPLLLHASAKSTQQKSRKVIHLEFTSVELPNGLEWEEKLVF